MTRNNIYNNNTIGYIIKSIIIRTGTKTLIKHRSLNNNITHIYINTLTILASTCAFVLYYTNAAELHTQYMWVFIINYSFVEIPVSLCFSKFCKKKISREIKYFSVTNYTKLFIT